MNEGDDVSMTCTVLDAKPDMILFWRKTQENNQTTTIGTNKYLEPKFESTKRYNITTRIEGTTVEFTLSIHCK